MLKGRLKTYLPRTWRSRIGVLLGIAAISIYTLPCMLISPPLAWAEGVSTPQESAASSSMDDMQRELRALKAQVESLRAELGATKQQEEAKADEELFASKQEFSQLSREVQGLKQQQPEVVATLKDQIKKEIGFLPNTYNELANKIRIGMELRTRGEYSNMFHNVLAHMGDSQAGFSGIDSHLGATQIGASAQAVPGGAGTGPTAGPFGKGRVGQVSEDQTIVLNRVRVNIDADVHENLRAFVQFQDSRFWGVEGGVLGFMSDQPNNRIDLHQAYFDVRKLMGKNLTLRIGRQEIIWGAHRMMGDFGWSNIGFTWDAARVLWEADRYAFQAFGAIQNHLAFNAATGDQDDDDQQTYGTMFTFKKLVPNATLELMYLMDNDQQVRAGTGFVATQGAETLGDTTDGEMEVHDFGLRLPGKVGKAIDYEAEYHYQTGEFRGQPHRAMAGMVKGGYTFDKVTWSPRVGYEFDWSPGDGDPNRGGESGSNIHHTFHQFYPTNHAHFGYIDLMAWKNMRAHRLQLNVKPTKKFRSQLDFWYFDLDNTNDGWYNAGQALFRRAPKLSEPGRHLGKEIDLTLWYDLYKNVGIMAGYSRFFSGTFIDATGREKALTGTGLFPAAAAAPLGLGKDEDTDWGFLQMTVSF